MIEVVYGFHMPDMGKLAESLSVVLGIRFHAQQSPMIGPWYTSLDLSAMMEVYRSGDQAAAQALAATVRDQPQLTLTLNDNGDYYYGGAEFPGQGACLLRVKADADWLRELDDRLSRSGLPYEKLSPSK